MIFIGEPNHFVRYSNKTVIRLTGKKGFYFDANGKYETENEIEAKVLKQHFQTEEPKTENNVKHEEIKKESKRGRK